MLMGALAAFVGCEAKGKVDTDSGDGAKVKVDVDKK